MIQINEHSTLKEVLTLLNDHVQRESTLDALKTGVFLHKEVQGLQAFLATNEWNVDRLSTFISKAENQKEKLFNTSAKRSIQLRPWMKYAAVFIPISLLGALIWSNYFRENKPASENWIIAYKKYEPGIPVVMSVGKNKEFNEAMLHFKNNDFKNAKIGFELCEKQQDQNDTLNYFLGICNMELDAFQSALNNFQQVPASSVYFWKAQYNVILSNIQLNQVQVAKNALNNYITNVPSKEEKENGKHLLNEVFFDK